MLLALALRVPAIISNDMSTDDIKRSIIREKLAKLNDLETASALIDHFFGRELFRRLCDFFEGKGLDEKKNKAVGKE